MNKKLFTVLTVALAASLIYLGVNINSANNKEDVQPVVAGASTNYNNDNNDDHTGAPTQSITPAGSSPDTGYNSTPAPKSTKKSGALSYNLSVGSANTGAVTVASNGGTPAGQGGGSTPAPAPAPAPSPAPAPAPAPAPSPVPQPTSNLITNGDMETVNGTTPAGFTADSWGNNVATLTYPVTGHTGNGAQVSYTSYTADPVNGGDAKYTTAPVTVTAGQAYQFSNYYKSDTATQVDYFDGNGTWLGSFGPAAAAANWTQFKGTATIPAGVTSIKIGHILNKVGTLTTDDYSLSAYTPVGFTRPIVSINFDDGWTNQYTNGFAALQAAGLNATFFMISGELTDQPAYMSTAQMLQIQAAGNEIGAHTVHHCDLTGQQTDDAINCPLAITAAQIQSEMADSKTQLQTALGGVQVTDFAYPYGAFNANTISLGQSIGYLSQRSVIGGLNTKDTLNLTQVKIHEVDSNITTAQVQAWVDEAIANNGWLVLVYHEIATTPTDPSDALYMTTPTDLSAQLNYIKGKGVAVETMKQAVAEVSVQ
jgi:peptidoglycan/xylan/chitin deacetylase (PgdA/CDA1 family)